MGRQTNGPRALRARAVGRSPARPVVAWLAVLGAGLLAYWLPASAPEEATADEATVAQGGDLYQRYCAVCHAHDGSGVEGVAPAIDGFSVAAVDLTMRTGRMPLADPMRGVRERTFTAQEREAVMGYLIEHIGLEGDLPEPGVGVASDGREVYAVHCAQCHGASAAGGLAGDGVEIPPVVGADPVTVASATREGPFQMPRFDEGVVSDEEIDDIAAFLDEGVHEPTSPLGLAKVSKFEAVGFAALLTVAVALLCAWAGGRRRRSPHEQGEPQ